MVTSRQRRMNSIVASATGDSTGGHPALKDRAKFRPPLRVEESVPLRVESTIVQLHFELNPPFDIFHSVIFLNSLRGDSCYSWISGLARR
jgi:hypothetical protein